MSKAVVQARRGACHAATETCDLPRLAFVHIPRTAGTAVTSALQRAYGTQTFPAMTTLDYRACDDASLQCFRLYKGHAYRADYQRLPSDTVRFTILRDPVRRALSYFNYFRALDDSNVQDEFAREACQLAKAASPIEFVYSDSPFVIEQVRLGQVRQFLTPDTLKAIAHRQFLSRTLRRQAVHEFVAEIANFDYVMTSECVALSYPVMAARLGLPAASRQLGRDNFCTSSADVDLADLRRALIDVNAAEFDCYEHARQRELAFLYEALAPCLDAFSLAA
jgi:hypothetical protein